MRTDPFILNGTRGPIIISFMEFKGSKQANKNKLLLHLVHQVSACVM